MAENTKKQKSNHGGRRPGAGRKKGVVAETKRTLAESARELGPRMLQVLANIAEDPDQPASSRVSAANHILERGYGKAVAPVETEQNDPLANFLAEISKEGSAAPISTAHLYTDDEKSSN